jgi:hypothetical protein
VNSGPILQLARRDGGHARSGTMLILIAGISTLMLAVSLTFLVTMRSDSEESAQVVREAQARIVLIAGLHYIQEASRLGWDRPATTEHEEAFGWVDIRDGSAGPKDATGAPLWPVGSGVFPDTGGTAARCPLYMMQRPPYATKAAYTYNPAPMDPSKPWRELVGYKNPDPQPVATTWKDFASGDPQPRLDSLGLAWFRVYRDKDDSDPATPPVEPATFTITCGAGGTMGFRTYHEAQAAGEAGYFGNDPNHFALLRAQERLLWFRTEWTSGVGGSGMGIRSINGRWDLPEINKGSYPGVAGEHHWWVNRNLIGSFLWIQRLDHEPDHW